MSIGRSIGWGVPRGRAARGWRLVGLFAAVALVGASALAEPAPQPSKGPTRLIPAAPPPTAAAAPTPPTPAAAPTPLTPPAPTSAVPPPPADSSAAPADEEILSSPSLAASAASPPQNTPPAPAPDPTVNDQDPRAMQDFHPQLTQYGTWVDDSQYGTVWVPDRTLVGSSFSPYVTGGHWAMDSSDNWVWESDYPFGPIVFHYGRWVWTSYGWSWVPGYQYAPAWVTWRVPTAGYAYLGWAPMPPVFVWRSGIAVSLWTPAPYYWVFCPSAYVFAPYPSYYVVSHPTYVRNLGHYTRRYVAAAPGVAARGPSLAAAGIPRTAWPSSRVAARPAVAAGSVHIASRPQAVHVGESARFVSARPVGGPLSSAGFAHTSSFEAARRSPGAPRTVAPPRTVTAFDSSTARSDRAYFRAQDPFARERAASPRAFSDRTVFSGDRARYTPPTRVYSSPERSYSPPQHFQAPVRTYSPPAARAYSPGAAGRVYTPPAMRTTPTPSHVYSPPAPRMYSPPSSHSAPTFHSAPSFHSVHRR